MRILHSFLLFASLAASASGQSVPADSARTGSIRGLVTEAETGETLIGAAVRLDGTTLGVATDTEGRFQLDGIPVGEYAVSVSYTGFQTLTQRVVIRREETTSLEVELEDGSELDVVTLVHCWWTPPLVARGPFTSRIARSRVNMSRAETEDGKWCPPLAENQVYIRDM